MQVFTNGMDKDTLVLYAARASRVENQDAIDASIVGMLGDPKEVYIMIQTRKLYCELHLLLSLYIKHAK